MSMVVQAHGANRGASCAKCRKDADMVKLQQSIKDEQVMRCGCGGPVKPDITFFGEGLPQEFFKACKET
jgi:NAD+-dependent protein deacetylase SIR2